MSINETELLDKITHLMSVPRYLSASSIAEMLDCSVRTVRERYALLDEFPAPHYLPEGERGRPAKRWRQSDIIDWMNNNKS